MKKVNLKKHENNIAAELKVSYIVKQKISNEEITKQLDDRTVFQAILIPFEDRMPKSVKAFLIACRDEFHSRKIKLQPII